MDGVHVCLPRREYAKQHNGGAQPSEAIQKLLLERTRRGR
jgi:hypothetical protein